MQTFRPSWTVQIHGQVLVCPWRSWIEKPNISSLNSDEQNGGRRESNEWSIDACPLLNWYEWCKQYESVPRHNDAKLDAISIKHVHGSSKSKYAYDELSRSRPLKPAVPLGNHAKLIHANADAKLVHGNAGNGSRISQPATNRVFQINWEIIRWIPTFSQ